MDLRHREELQKRGPDATDLATGTTEQWLRSYRAVATQLQVGDAKVQNKLHWVVHFKARQNAFGKCTGRRRAEESLSMLLT